MKDLVEYIAKNIVSNPELIETTETADEFGTTVELKVPKEDIGKVIGKQGKIARAIRTVVKAASLREGKDVQIKISEKE